jgi:tetratricopeptide (TPR) repeat protein
MIPAARGVQRSVLPLLAMTVLVAPHAAAEESLPAEASLDTRPALEEIWREAQLAESAGFDHDRTDPERAIAYFQRAGELFESVAEQRTDPKGIAEAYWRGARSWWLVADAHPREAEKQRIRYYLIAEALAEKGMETDPGCAGCILWKFSSMGRLTTTRGVWTAGRQIPVMADLLDRGIALEPTHADNDDNSVLGNLHYSSAIFYRVLPDWFFMTWFFGVRGDKDRSLRHIETALTLHPNRLEYQVELGSQLLCRGTSKKDAAQLEEGLEVLRTAIRRQPQSLDDEREIEAAGIMLEAPKKACGYSGDSWLEIDRKRASRTVKE